MTNTARDAEREHLDPGASGRRGPVTLTALGLITLLAVAVLLAPGGTTAAIAFITRSLLHIAGDTVLIFASSLVLLCALIAAGPAGRLRLGAADEAPEFGLPSWLAMLFAAGMGSGLVFWGVAEPLTHMASLRDEGVEQAAASGLAMTWFHWGLHAWSIYATAALTIAWFHTRAGLTETPSASIAAGWRGWLPRGLATNLGRVADLIAVAAVVFGVAGALANSIVLLRAGIDAATGWAPAAVPLQLGILALLALTFMASAVSGIGRGIRWLSDINMIAAFALLLALMALGTGATSLTLTLDALGHWAASLPGWSVRPIEMAANANWAQEWTLTNLLWWIAWTPFVGVFVARISRGRTLRTFLLGVVLVPSLVSMLWFAILGGGALGWDAANGGALESALAEHYTRPLFVWLEALPLGTLLMVLVCVLLFVFMITSADSACFVLGMLSSGKTSPGAATKLAWGLLLTGLTAGLLLRNDVDVNRAVAIVGALPFSLFLLLQVIALCRALLAELRR